MTICIANCVIICIIYLYIFLDTSLACLSLCTPGVGSDGALIACLCCQLIYVSFNTGIIR